MSEREISDALEGLNAVTKKYKKGTTILHAGSTTKRMGLVLEGSVTIENNDIWGNKTILSHVGKNQFFAETYGLLADEPMLVDVVANEDCQILFLTIGFLHRDGRRRSPSWNRVSTASGTTNIHIFLKEPSTALSAASAC